MGPVSNRGVSGGSGVLPWSIWRAHYLTLEYLVGPVPYSGLTDGVGIFSGLSGGSGFLL